MRALNATENESKAHEAKTRNSPRGESSRAAAWYIALTVLMTTSVVACSSSASPPGAAPLTINGSSAALGNGTATSWVKTGADGKAVAMGLSFGDSALKGLPAEMSMAVLPLPLINGLPFDTAVINWNPHGHPPAGIYTVPHFDLHFYNIDEQARASISPTSPQASITPAPLLVPAGYVADPAGVVPAMGLHYLPTYQPEFHGHPFTATPIYGFWNGQDDFVEGMVSTAVLATHAPIDQPLHQPAAVTRSGSYPTQWHIAYDADAHIFNVSFDHFVER